MEALEAIFTRRSIRRYSNKQIDKATVDKIIQAGMYAPSAVNKQPWHFLVFSDEEKKHNIINVHKNASLIEGANRCILICYDKVLQHDEGYGAVDCSAATQNMLLAAHTLGLGACWVGIYPRKKRIKSLQSIFSLPKQVIPFAIIALGFPDEHKATPDRLKPERIHYDKW